jgi:hypothetical protein
MAETDCAPQFPVEKWLPFLLASLVAVVSVCPYAGCWNDGSRLATVESLVDRHTFVIDDSIFVRVPADNPPYPDNPLLAERGTLDKMCIFGRFYSDKSPLPAVFLAVVYAVWQCFTGLTASARPDLFCYFLGLLSSGLAYVVAVVSLDRLARILRLPSPARWALTLSFALSTVALVYVRHVNNHILLLGVAMAMMPEMALLAGGAQQGERHWKRLTVLGTLAGFGYTIDLGAGPLLLMCLLGLVAVRFRKPLSVGTVLLAALPWVLAHHVLNYWVGGSWKPANANPEFFNWPGSPFPPQTLTGSWNHHSLPDLGVYALSLLFGKRGFVGHNLPLFLLIPALPTLCRSTRERSELAFALLWCGLTWVLYAWASTNYSGQCCSVRWFVPLLAPCYYALGVFLRESPRSVGSFAVLSAWGALLAGLAWWYGPWIRHLVPGFWPIQLAALACWIAYVSRFRPRPTETEHEAARRAGNVTHTRIPYESHPPTAVPAGGAGDRVGREQLPTV